MKSITKIFLLAIVIFPTLLFFSAFQYNSSKEIFSESKSILGKDRTVTIDKLPTTVEEFLEMRNKISKTPEGGATTMIVALMIYSQNEELGLACLTIAADKKRLSKTTKNEGYKGYIVSRNDLGLIKTQIKRSPYVPFSYVKGTTVDNGYKLPTGKLVFDYSTNKYSGDEKEGEIKLFIPSSGADSARPVRVHKNDAGIWKATEWSSLIVGIRAPKVDDDDDL
ncbi:hypothetical protein V9L05_21460 [Bernardetia sp. Wsw4-3y2]|uniref:DUF6935 domain-containing protein n=1 Tax=Bernardetia sp. Wsw4-3y2 TaxID=3127471 RepID=UPI0030D10B75